MSDVIGTVHGKHHTFEIKKRSSTFGSSTYFVVRDDGKVSGSYDSRAAAFKAAHEQAGPDSYEVK